jgi:hypothetical protein
MTAVVDKLSDARDFYALTKAILSLCEPFGPVHSFRFIHNRGAARVACIIELETAKQQPALARALGARTLNGAICLEIPVGRDFGSPITAAPLTSRPIDAGFDARRGFASEHLAQ